MSTKRLEERIKMHERALAEDMPRAYPDQYDFLVTVMNYRDAQTGYLKLRGKVVPNNIIPDDATKKQVHMVVRQSYNATLPNILAHEKQKYQELRRQSPQMLLFDYPKDR